MTRPSSRRGPALASFAGGRSPARPLRWRAGARRLLGLSLCAHPPRRLLRSTACRLRRCFLRFAASRSRRLRPCRAAPVAAIVPAARAPQLAPFCCFAGLAPVGCGADRRRLALVVLCAASVAGCCLASCGGARFALRLAPAPVRCFGRVGVVGRSLPRCGFPLPPTRPPRALPLSLRRVHPEG